MHIAYRELFERTLPDMPGHVFVATSGTSGTVKLVALSKDAILASAAAVNGYFGATRGDVWCCVLPTFHVGGLGIHARAFLTGSRVITMPWDPQEFARTEATLASLVPAQVYDLVQAGLRPPPNLRAILVGGGAFDAATAPGWPVHASYGMSECASTIAVEGELLPHLEARTNEEGRLAFRGPSLLTAYVYMGGRVVDPKVDGWFMSEDVGEVNGSHVTVKGRSGDFIKIGGESVDLARLDRILHEIAGDAAAIVAVPHERLGYTIQLATTVDDFNIVDRFNARVMPYEKIRRVHRVETIPRSPLGKLLRNQILK
jgi:O-succinylbenzoic acid--CoA ligase